MNLTSFDLYSDEGLAFIRLSLSEITAANDSVGYGDKANLNTGTHLIILSKSDCSADESPDSSSYSSRCSDQQDRLPNTLIGHNENMIASRDISFATT